MFPTRLVNKEGELVPVKMGKENVVERAKNSEFLSHFFFLSFLVCFFLGLLERTAAA
jgi:hypothetical protein